MVAEDAWRESNGVNRLSQQSASAELTARDAMMLNGDVRHIATLSIRISEPG
jgi:hypothetical protein